MVLLAELRMVFLSDPKLESHMDLMMCLCLDMMKALKLAPLIENCLVLHLELMMETQLGQMK